MAVSRRIARMPDAVMPAAPGILRSAASTPAATAHAADVPVFSADASSGSRKWLGAQMSGLLAGRPLASGKVPGPWADPAIARSVLAHGAGLAAIAGSEHHVDMGHAFGTEALVQQAHAGLGQRSAAKVSAMQILRLDPGFSVARYAAERMPFVDAALKARAVHHLKFARLPD
jgi:hypothetical protein